MKNFKIHDLQPEGYPQREEHVGSLLPTCGVTHSVPCQHPCLKGLHKNTILHFTLRNTFEINN